MGHSSAPRSLIRRRGRARYKMLHARAGLPLTPASPSSAATRNASPRPVPTTRSLRAPGPTKTTAVMAVLWLCPGNLGYRTLTRRSVQPVPCGRRTASTTVCCVADSLGIPACSRLNHLGPHTVRQPKGSLSHPPVALSLNQQNPVHCSVLDPQYRLPAAQSPGPNEPLRSFTLLLDNLIYGVLNFLPHSRSIA